VPKLTWRSPILGAGLALVAIETCGSVSYLLTRDGGGSAINRANMTVAEQARRIELADAAVADAKVALDTAETAATSECKTGRGPKCQGLEVREREARTELEAARAKAGSIGAKSTNPLVSRLVAMLPISEERVALFEPLVLPLTL